MSNAIRCVVQSTNLTNVKKFDGNGKFYGTQSAAIFNGGDFPMPFGVNVEQGNEYAPGEYTIDPRSFQRDGMGNLKLQKLKLLPLGGSSKPAGKPGTVM